MLCFLKYLAVSSMAVVGHAKLQSEYPEPPAILSPTTDWYDSYGNSRVGTIAAPFTGTDGNPDYVNAFRLDLVGTTSERGEAYGAMMAKQIIKFATVELDKYYMKMVADLLDLDWSQYPEPLQKILQVIQVKGALAAPAAFNKALEWVYEAEEQYMPAYLVEEMEAMGKGICLGLAKTGEACDPEAMTMMIKRVNMLPELIRMACTAYGAWGTATPDGKLTQIRALDFGSGPFGNYTIVGVYRSAPDAAEQERAFATVMFPGMVGVITGVSDKGVGISEKVWMTYDTPSLQPGSYDGEPDVFVLRDLLQKAGTREEAEAHMNEVKRTFAIWVGVGDYASQKMDIVGYLEASATPYTDVTMPSNTGQQYIENVVYVDKHPQPSHDGTTGTLPVGLEDFWGNLTMANSRMVLQSHQTGDQHIAMYDFGNEQMLVSIGRINEDGDYGPVGGDLSSWKAYNRPYLQFSLQDLWTGA